MSVRRPLSPVLLLGAGAGEATCGILYLASYLRRGGIEAYVRLWESDETEAEVRRSLEALLARVRPRLVGISFKWFHHVHRALRMARILRSLDPEVRIVVGGNSASFFWRELSAFDCIDDLILGDGERPLLALCQGEENPPNTISRAKDGTPRRLPLQYVQGASNTDDLHYSHFEELFLSQLDLHSFSGWVAPGKGCAENCLYCAGARGNQKADFGRAKPFLRDEQYVRRDHQEIAPHTWQVRYDFSGSTAEFLGSTWAGVDLSRHSCTYFLWGVPRMGLIDALARTFQRVFMVLDIGCFSETQRLDLMQRGLLKPCATDRQLLELIAECRRHSNLEIEVSGIAGLPFATRRTLEEELRLAEKVAGLDCMVGSQRLQSQPGALVTEHPARFGMISEARSFDDFLRYFEALGPGDTRLPLIRFEDEALEAAVQRTSDRVDQVAWEHAEAKRPAPIDGRTRLRNTAVTGQFALADWLGKHRVPPKLAREPVTVIRSVDGLGLHCAPTVSPRRFSDPALTQGDDAGVLLAALETFSRPTPVATAVSQLGAKARLDPHSAREVIDHLVEGRFLQRA